jgi:hypothetical protein
MKIHPSAGLALLLAAGFLVMGSTCIFGTPPPEPVIEEPAPEPTVNIDKVDQRIRTAVSATDNTTIYTNVFNLSGGSCVDASTRRGQGIASSLQRMADDGELPGHTVRVYTYSGYRVPGIEFGSLHTYTVTQLIGPDGNAVSTWTADDYLGPRSVTRLDGSGGYDNWNDPLTSEVGVVRTRDRGNEGGRGGGGGD